MYSLNQFYSILNGNINCVNNISLATIETVYNPLVNKKIQNDTFVLKPLEIQFLTKLQIPKEKTMNNTKNILDNGYFKKIIFSMMIISNIIINLGYLQSRDSSKVD